MEPSRSKPPAPSFPVPVPVLIGALIAGFLAVGAAWFAMQKSANPATGKPGDSVSVADTALDVQWNSGRASGPDCVGTFVIAHGAGARIHFVAMALDGKGAEIARDSADVPATTPGTTFDVRFRGMGCNAMKDWQLQAVTPKP